MPRVREWEESMDPTCPFCWPGTIPKSEEEGVLVERKRIEANDPIALRQIGVRRYRKEDYSGAFEYWTKAAGLGDAGLHFELTSMYHKGNGVEKDEKKEVYHLEETAIRGHAYARNNLGCMEEAKRSGRVDDRAMIKHWVIAANLGHDDALEALGGAYTAAALRAHQAAVDETKSLQREAAEVGLQNSNYLISLSLSCLFTLGLFHNERVFLVLFFTTLPLHIVIVAL
jgi:TPR repeat protein